MSKKKGMMGLLKDAKNDIVSGIKNKGTVPASAGKVHQNDPRTYDQVYGNVGEGNYGGYAPAGYPAERKPTAPKPTAVYQQAAPPAGPQHHYPVYNTPGAPVYNTPGAPAHAYAVPNVQVHAPNTNANAAHGKLPSNAYLPHSVASIGGAGGTGGAPQYEAYAPSPSTQQNAYHASSYNPNAPPTKPSPLQKKPDKTVTQSQAVSAIFPTFEESTYIKKPEPIMTADGIIISTHSNKLSPNSGKKASGGDAGKKASGGDAGILNKPRTEQSMIRQEQANEARKEAYREMKRKNKGGAAAKSAEITDEADDPLNFTGGAFME